MEKLKSFIHLLSEDKRFADMMLAGREENEPLYSFEQHYNRYSVFELPDGAPIEIIGGLITAQHLAIFAWFVYPFSTSAKFQALSTLEHAIRRCMFNERAPGLKMRLINAVKEGLIKGDKLYKLDPYIVPVSKSEFANRKLDPDGIENLKLFIDNLPEERNWLAHGNWIMGQDVFMILDIVIQLVNQLYSTPPNHMNHEVKR